MNVITVDLSATLDILAAETTLPEVVQLDDERAAIDCVDDDPAAGEAVMAPGSVGPVRKTATRERVVLWVCVEEGDLADALPRRIAWNAADIEDTQTSLVVGLEGETVVLGRR